MDSYSWFGYEDKAREQTVINLIRREMPRLRVFVSRSFDRDSISVFPLDAYTEAPNVEVFGIICDQNDINDPQEEFMGPIHTPKLQSLILRYCEIVLKYFMSTSFSRLRHLTLVLGVLPTMACINQLSECPNLESLLWRDRSEHYDTPMTLEGRRTSSAVFERPD